MAYHPPRWGRKRHIAAAAIVLLTSTVVISVAETRPKERTPVAASGASTPATRTSTIVAQTPTPKPRSPSRPAPSPTAQRVQHTPTPTARPGAGAQLIFDDEFNSTQLDTPQWIAINRPGDSSNAEQECFLPGNVAERSGSLVLTSQLDQSCSGYNYTSGQVQTSAFHFLYGRIDIRAKLPSGQGMWPALWLLGVNCQATYPTTPDNSGACQWPMPGSDEVDILEVKGQDPTTDYMTVHYGDAPNQDNSVQCIYTGPDFSQDYHTFSLAWSPGQLVWYIDGSQQCVQTTGVPSHAMFVIMEAAVGGNFVGNPDNSIFPQTFAIDYVRVYQ